MPGRAAILVVEDDFDVRQIVCTFLREQDYEVFEADSAESAMAILESDAPVDLLLTDIVLPGPDDGLTLARAARRLRPALKVLHITGHPEKGGGVATDELLKKPFRRPELLARIGMLLGRWSVDRNAVLRRAYEYWLDKAAGRRAPDRGDLDPAELKDILPYLSILEIVEEEGATHHRYRLVGTRVVDALGYNPTNHIVEEFSAHGHAEFMRGLCVEVAATARPLYAASSFRASNAGLSTERIFLPFTVGGAEIKQIVVVQTFDWIRRKRIIHELIEDHASRRDYVEHPPAATGAEGTARE